MKIYSLPDAVQVLPTGTQMAASMHVARGICRRAERCFVTLQQSEPDISLVTLRYLNRLSDLLFVLARVANSEAGIADTGWQKPSAS